MKRALRLRIHGRVQGVWYRASTRGEAEALGLVGWVRNRRDGTVEVLAEGEADALDALVAFCRTGPQLARVEHLDLDWGEATGAFAAFEVRPTE